MQMLEELGRYVIAEPYPFALDIQKGHGMWLVTVEGEELFDWAGFYGSRLLGHNHPGLFEPEYLRRLSYAANNKLANPDFLTVECLDYYRFLYENAPAVMKNPNLEVYAVNSGAEAVENMMKYLVATFNQRRASRQTPTGTRRFLYFDKAFHGRTVFALGVTQTIDPVATKDFQGLSTISNLKMPFPSYTSDASHLENLAEATRVLQQVESVLSLMAEEIVGVIVEPIQGAGGHRVALPEFFRGLSELCHRYEVPLAFDEVQTGFAATGKMWAIDHFDLPYPPMAVATGKKFGNGAVFMYEPLTDVGVLDSTWGGTLGDMVRIVREMEIVREEKLMENAASTGAYLAARLNELAAKYRPMLRNVRGLGLYQGFSLDTPARKASLISRALQEENLLLLGAGNRTIRMRPNLNVLPADVDLLFEKLDRLMATEPTA